MRIRRTKRAALCLGLSIIAAGQATGEPPPAVTELVDRARQQVTRIDRAAFAQVLQRIGCEPRSALVIDVREPDEVAVDMTLADWQAAGLPFTSP